MPPIKSLCVFCGASSGLRPEYNDAAHTFGETLATHDIELVWGGGHVGLMGAVADGVLAKGGRVYGVIPEFMAERELAHPMATELCVVDTMHARKAAMAARADAFVALPGGFGTMDELFEIMTWAQLQLHHKPIGLLNSNEFFAPLLAWMRHMASEGFVREHHLSQLHVANTAPALLAAMQAHEPQRGDWLEKVSLRQA